MERGISTKLKVYMASHKCIVLVTSLNGIPYRKKSMRFIQRYKHKKNNIQNIKSLQNKHKQSIQNTKLANNKKLVLPVIHKIVRNGTCNNYAIVL